MPSELSKLLAELHRLRRHIRDLNAEIERGPRVIKAYQTKLTKQEADLKAEHDAIKKKQVEQKDKDLSIKTAAQQKAKYEKQSNEVTEPKQVEALTHEIDHVKGVIAGLEDESLMLIMEIEERSAKIPVLEAALKKAKDDFVVAQKDGAERLVRLQADLKAATAELAAKEKPFEGPDRIAYDRLVKAFAAECLAKIENNACSQCQTSVTAQHRNDVEAGKFVACASCARGLYS